MKINMQVTKNAWLWMKKAELLQMHGKKEKFALLPFCRFYSKESTPPRLFFLAREVSRVFHSPTGKLWARDTKHILILAVHCTRMKEGK